METCSCLLGGGLSNVRCYFGIYGGVSDGYVVDLKVCQYIIVYRWIMSASTEVQNDVQQSESAWWSGVQEKGFWKYWLSTMSPERLEQRGQYDKERNKKYNQEHKEEPKQHRTYTCGRYHAYRMWKHMITEKHRHALAQLDQQRKDELELQRQSDVNRRQEERAQTLHEEVRCCICNELCKVRHASRHIKTWKHLQGLSASQEVQGKSER